MKIIVIVANGLQLGYLGCYGNDWITTPTFDRLAAEGVVFDQHIADQPGPAGARASWRSGCYPLPLPEDTAVPPPAPVDLVALLRHGGIHTALVVDGSRGSPGGLGDGWDEVIAAPATGPDGTPLEHTLEATADALDRLISRNRWLLWIELPTVLPPWEVPAEFLAHYFTEEAADAGPDAEVEEEREPLAPLTDPDQGLVDRSDGVTPARLRDTYAAAVTYLDSGLGQLLDDLHARGLEDEAALLVISDGGLPLGEHTLIGRCRPWLHEEVIHLPLLLRLPRAARAGLRIPALTQPVDLLPTLVELYGLPPVAVHGQSLWPLVNGARDRVRAYAVAGLRTGDALEWALRTPDWAFLLPVRPASGDPPRGPQLYVKPDDRWEVNNVWQHHQELAEHFEQVLRGFVDATRRPGPLQPPELRDVEGEVTKSEQANETEPLS